MTGSDRMGHGVPGAAGQSAISQRLCKNATHYSNSLNSNFPQEFTGEQLVEEPVEEYCSRDRDARRSAYESLRESLYLYRRRYIYCGANDDEHIRKGVG